jgi:hypothetical protein
MTPMSLFLNSAPLRTPLLWCPPCAMPPFRLGAYMLHKENILLKKDIGEYDDKKVN